MLAVLTLAGPGAAAPGLAAPKVWVSGFFATKQAATKIPASYTRAGGTLCYRAGGKPAFLYAVVGFRGMKNGTKGRAAFFRGAKQAASGAVRWSAGPKGRQSYSLAQKGGIADGRYAFEIRIAGQVARGRVRLLTPPAC